MLQIKWKAGFGTVLLFLSIGHKAAMSLQSWKLMAIKTPWKGIVILRLKVSAPWTEHLVGRNWMFPWKTRRRFEQISE